MLQPDSHDQFRWGVYDGMIRDLKNAGLESVIQLGGTPRWASTDPDNPDFVDYPPADIEDWKSFVQAVVERYGYGPNGRGQVRNWEIWNEPDIDQFFKGSPDDYLNLLNAAYDVIKERNPSAKIWGPTTIYFLDRLDDWMMDKTKYPFTQKAIEEGKMDVFSVHVYADIEESYRQISELREMLDSVSNKNGIPIAITETNVVVNDLCYDDISEEEQARMLTERYYCLVNAGAKSVFWWKPTDSEDTRCADGIQKNGLFRTDLSLKPAYYALREIGEFLNPLFLTFSFGYNQIIWPAGLGNDNVSTALFSIDSQCGQGTGVFMGQKRDGFWQGYVNNYGGMDFALREGESYIVKVNRACHWQP